MTNIKVETAKLLSTEFQITPEITDALFNIGVLNIQGCRDVLIKKEYERKVVPKERQRVKGEIAERYCISIELVRKIVE
jgi:hypothetical protein